MGDVIFDVTPETLQSSAGKIEDMTENFVKAYDSIYTAVNDLSLSYKGQASETFNKRIDGYRNDFEAAKKALDNYVQFLREYASEMQGVEDEIKSQAENLSVGN